MRYYQLVATDGEARLAVEPEEGVLADLASLDEDLTGIDDLVWCNQS